MSEIRLSSEKRLRLFAGRGFPELADEVAAELGIPLTPMSAYDFANGVEKMPVVAGAVVAVSQRSIFSLLSSITDAFGFGPKIRSAMNQTSPEQEKSVAAAADEVKKVSKN